MRVIAPSYEILDRRGLNVAQKIEYAGRTAYKSEDKITDSSAFAFLKKITDMEHFPVIEFANVHVFIACNMSVDEFDWKIAEFVNDGQHLKYITMAVHQASDGEHAIIVSGTVRAFLELIHKGSEDIFENTLMGALVSALNEDNPFFPFKFTDNDNKLLDPTMDQRIRSTLVPSSFVYEQLKSDPPQLEKHLMCAVKFICNRAVTHELVRHRPVTIIQESQRYCRYSLAKFGNEVTFIEPSAFFPCPGQFPDHPAFDSKYVDYYLWEKSCKEAEETYLLLIERGNSPQAARTVLPNSCKTEIIIYATIEEWRHIRKMRVSPAAEPSMRQLTIPLFEEFFSEENKEKWE